MHDEIPVARTILKDENAIRWEFLEDQRDACAVVSERKSVEEATVFVGFDAET